MERAVEKEAAGATVLGDESCAPAEAGWFSGGHAPSWAVRGGGPSRGVSWPGTPEDWEPSFSAPGQSRALCFSPLLEGRF